MTYTEEQLMDKKFVICELSELRDIQKDIRKEFKKAPTDELFEELHKIEMNIKELESAIY